jgi:hypothetical protein
VTREEGHLNSESMFAEDDLLRYSTNPMPLLLHLLASLFSSECRTPMCKFLKRFYAPCDAAGIVIDPDFSQRKIITPFPAVAPHTLARPCKLSRSRRVRQRALRCRNAMLLENVYTGFMSYFPWMSKLVV